ncbi:T9SS type A sorting domain-containing protein [bacterium]|nr:T9SS type A sorting domain-containing protein [bacterium]
MVALRLASTDGEILWVNRVDAGGRNDRAYAALVDATGDLIVTGTSVNPDESADFLTLKLAAGDGQVLWTRRAPGALNNETPSGWLGLAAGGSDVFMANKTWQTGHSFDVVLARYAGADGAVEWTRQIDHGGVADDPRQMIVDGAGWPVVVGVSAGNFMTLRVDPATGDPLWARFKDGPMGWYDIANCATVGPGGLILTGGFMDGGASTWDAAVVAYEPASGDEAWSLVWDGEDSLTDELRALAQGPGGELYAVGYSYATGTDMDMLALQYRFAPTAVDSPWLPAALTARAWPNPFRESVQLRFALPAAGAYRASIHDAQGRLLRSFAGEGAAGEQGLAWDGRDGAGRAQPAGLYFVRIAAEGAEWSGRLLKLR